MLAVEAKQNASVAGTDDRYFDAPKRTCSQREQKTIQRVNNAGKRFGEPWRLQAHMFRDSHQGLVQSLSRAMRHQIVAKRGGPFAIRVRVQRYRLFLLETCSGASKDHLANHFVAKEVPCPGNRLSQT